jgi:hypothetical protein
MKELVIHRDNPHLSKGDSILRVPDISPSNLERRLRLSHTNVALKTVDRDKPRDSAAFFG